MRYKFYREHKYISFALNNLEQLIAKIDFTDPEQLELVKQEFGSVINLLEGHAHYENTRLHTLLKAKESPVYKHVEEEHQALEKAIAYLTSLLSKAQQSTTEEEQIENGYKFYLHYRKFVGDNLLHLHEEETVILPELQRLYTDKELQAVESEAYKQMTAEQIIDMIHELFPHMNSSDREAILKDIKDLEPEKFIQVWENIHTNFADQEKQNLIQTLGL